MMHITIPSLEYDCSKSVFVFEKTAGLCNESVTTELFRLQCFTRLGDMVSEAFRHHPGAWECVPLSSNASDRMVGLDENRVCCCLVEDSKNCRHADLELRSRVRPGVREGGGWFFHKIFAC